MLEELSLELEPYRSASAQTIKPYIEIQLTNNSYPTWWESKIGGFPYLPKNFEYPQDETEENFGENLFLLAQINFSEVPPLENFPEQGILQFYISGRYSESYVFGLSIKGKTTEQKGFRVLYFKDIDEYKSNLLTDFSFLPEVSPESVEAEDVYLPINGCRRLKFFQKYAPIGINDHQYNFFSENTADEQLEDLYADTFDASGSKIGGYPNFIQRDPRTDYPEDQEKYILLLQIDTYFTNDEDSFFICWEDGGVGNFFIKKSSLKKLDFSEVVYHWDCG